MSIAEKADAHIGPLHSLFVDTTVYNVIMKNSFPITPLLLPHNNTAGEPF